MCSSCSVYLPVGHGLKLQGLFSKRSPTQGFPPAPGGGLSHRRVLMLFPGPHDALHALQSLQFPHPPLTTTSKKFNQIQGLFLFLNRPPLPAPGSPLLNFFMLIDRAIFVWPWNENARTKPNQETNGNRAIWLVHRADTNARVYFMPENFLEINPFFALTSYCNTIGQSNNAFSILGFSLACFDLFILWLIKQITNTYRNHFSRSYENRSNSSSLFAAGQSRGM